ncbi:predicted protein [Postia placenta Mad-698-R]|nr:predicted protein [Postia placenta Mad-698-R]
MSAFVTRNPDVTLHAHARLNNSPAAELFYYVPFHSVRDGGHLDYAGLPSPPVLVARTSTTPWEAFTGLEAYRNVKELRAVSNHALKEAWEDDLTLKLHALLDSMKVKWTSTDVVRIGNAGSLDIVSSRASAFLVSRYHEVFVGLIDDTSHIEAEQTLYDVDVDATDGALTSSHVQGFALMDLISRGHEARAPSLLALPDWYFEEI